MQFFVSNLIVIHILVPLIWTGSVSDVSKSKLILLDSSCLTDTSYNNGIENHMGWAVIKNKYTNNNIHRVLDRVLITNNLHW